MEQGYLFKAKDQDHYSYGHPQRMLSYELFKTAKSYGIRMEYQDGSYTVYEQFIDLSHNDKMTYRKVIKP